MKILLNSFLFLLLFCLGYIIYGFYCFISIFSGYDYNKQEIISNFNKNEEKINVVKDYFISIVPQNTKVSIEFDHGTITQFSVIDSSKNYDSHWNLSFNDLKTKKLLQKLNWQLKTLKDLKNKLAAADCISIENNTNDIRIGWKRSGMGLYSFNLLEFDLTYSQNLREKLTDTCSFIYYKENIVFEYSGGAIGSQCFPIKN